MRSLQAESPDNFRGYTTHIRYSQEQHIVAKQLIFYLISFNPETTPHLISQTLIR
jgi:hypothetical protein